MPLTNALIVLGVFAAFGLMILAKLKQKNHPLYVSLRDWINDAKKKGPSMLKKKEEPQPIKLPEDARIM